MIIMKNKEIEELLNNFQEILKNPTTTDECYDGRIIEIDRSYDLEQDEIKLLLSYIEQLQKKAELGEHYKHLYSEVKKQKDVVVEYIKNNFIEGEVFYSKAWLKMKKDDLLRMLGEIE